MTVHDEAVPGSTEDATELRDSKSIGVATHCGKGRKRTQQLRQEHHVTDEEVSYKSFDSADIYIRDLLSLFVSMFTKGWVSFRQVPQHGVEGADEEVMPELHH